MSDGGGMPRAPRRRGDDPAALKALEDKLMSVHFHRFAGLRIAERAADGSVTCALPAEGDAVTPFGTLHGGILTGAYELPALLTLLPDLAPDEWAVTVEVHARNLRPIPAGSLVLLSSRLLRRGRTAAFLDVTATVDGRLVGTASITKAIVPEAQP